MAQIMPLSLAFYPFFPVDMIMYNHFILVSNTMDGGTVEFLWKR